MTETTNTTYATGTKIVVRRATGQLFTAHVTDARPAPRPGFVSVLEGVGRMNDATGVFYPVADTETWYPGIFDTNGEYRGSKFK